MIKLKLLFILSLITVLSSCGPKPYSDADGLSGATSSNNTEEYKKFRELLGTKCASCHSGNTYEFSIQDDEKSMEALGFIVPGSAVTSPLYECVTRNDGGSECDSIMPPGNALKQDEMDIIKNYIDSL